MSLHDRIKAAKNKKTKFMVVAGRRFGGKSSSLGTLPGKTLIIEITDKEAGADGAVAVAREQGNTVDVVTGIDCEDTLGLAREAFEAGYDNVAVDGLSALSEVEAEKPKVKKMLNAGGNAVFGGWRVIGGELTNLIQELKALSLEFNKPVVLTLALKEKLDGEGNVVHLDPECKGNLAISFIKGKCKTFLIARKATDKDGKPLYVIQTRDDDVYNARIDGVLAKDNPGGFRAEIEKVEKGKPGLAGFLEFMDAYWD